MSHDPRKLLLEMRVEVDHLGWLYLGHKMPQWVDKASQIIGDNWPDQLERFRLLAAEPKSPAMKVDDQRDLDDALEEAEIRCEAEVDKLELEWKGNLCNFLDNLLLAPREPKPVPQSHAVWEHTTPPEITDSLPLFRRDHPDSSKVAFLMMRFSETPAHEGIVRAIRETLRPLGILALRADDKQYHADLWPNILTYLVGCSFGIAVFERLEQDEYNPNVALEVGYFYGVKKPVCLLKDKTLKVLHADIVGKLWCPFDPQAPEQTIPPRLKKWMSDNGIA